VPPLPIHLVAPHGAIEAIVQGAQQAHALRSHLANTKQADHVPTTTTHRSALDHHHVPANLGEPDGAGQASDAQADDEGAT